MNLKLNPKMIKERCGIVSFKRGEAFFRSNKVIFESRNSQRCEAIVKGTEDFHVILQKEGKELKAKCSCPSLVSYQRDCQHVAAVLLAVYDNQKSGKEITAPNEQGEVPSEPGLTENLWKIFNEEKRSSSHRLHFENRQVLEVGFYCKVIQLEEGRSIIGMEMSIEEINIPYIHEFLQNWKEGKLSILSPEFTYNPALHCFSKDIDTVVEQLVHIIEDETIYAKTQQQFGRQILYIPPSSWEYLKPLLAKLKSVELHYNGHTFAGLHFKNESLPVSFTFSKTLNNRYQLKVNGLEDLIVLESYQSILYKGKLYEFRPGDFDKLVSIKQMLTESGADEILIPSQQFQFMKEQVIPALKRIVRVQLSTEILEQMNKTPLVAKLYLDRVKNRLLAGLEFQYDNVVFNPLEEITDIQTNTMMVRDIEKEDIILQLMKDGRFTQTEGGYFLHNEELEYEFLYHIVPKLQKYVQLYATTSVRNRIIKKNTKPRIRVKSTKERTNWLEFQFEMNGIPEKEIREILLAIEEKRKYYRLKDGALFSLETKELEEIHRFLYALPIEKDLLDGSIQVPIVQGIKALSSIEDQDLLDVEKSLRGFLENISTNKFEVPQQVKAILRDYQARGFQWMKTLASYGFGGILADDMGLGKTLQSITFILSELTTIRNGKHPVLIVCPSSLTYNWLSELFKFAPEIQAVVMDGNKKERYQLQQSLQSMDVIITSYPLLRSDIHWYEKQNFHAVFFDEAQSFKNPGTQTARAVKKIQANHRFALTGTPIENSLEELWSIFHIVFPDLFHGFKDYSNLTRKTIARRIRPFLLRRMKEDVLSELPEKVEERASVELLPDQKKLYAAYLAKLRHDTLKHLDKDTLRKNRIRILAGLTRLRQICCHPALFVDGYQGSSAKFERLMQMIEESKEAGRRVLIFSQFTKMLGLIGKALTARGHSFYYLDGQTPSEERIQLCNQFNNGGRDLFLISLKAGGTGLNLTGADTVILYDTWWNPAVEEQAADRAHRIGQQNTVQVIKLISRGTIEEKINELQDKKRHLIDEIIHPDEGGALSLTEEDIREILMI
ncbi:MAG: SNF2 helicase associated domain-containing protein [Heyndrickxia sp.]